MRGHPNEGICLTLGMTVAPGTVPIPALTGAPPPHTSLTLKQEDSRWSALPDEA